ncbi:hypothetical protein QCA50_002915 [Cerrena zonata]|uniref:Uncharacterized protein n=1 Tax=Cerrena zonata TaxID=2478898 RepID=A0AAW0GN76_9APHY
MDPSRSPIRRNRIVEDLSRFQSPLLETPEPEARQGRRNFRALGVQLLDNDGAMSERFISCLKHIFGKYCTPRPSAETAGGLLVPLENAYLPQEGLDRWAIDTNGMPFDDETKQELADFMDVTDDGDLTLYGFLQVYQLQTENDEEETWKDLATHGFDRTLNLVATRREDDQDYEMATPPQPPRSSGVGKTSWVIDDNGEIVMQ